MDRCGRPAESLLKGYGLRMAALEISSHCELLAASGDVRFMNSRKYEAVGGRSFETLILGLAGD